MDVIGFENPIMDFLLQADRLPGSNEAVPFKQVSWQGGGPVGSAMSCAGRLGAAAGVVGAVVDDPYGRFCLNDFKRHGVDTSHVVIETEGSTAFCLCLAETTTNMRSFIYGQGTRKIQPEELDKDYILSAKYIHMWEMNPTTVKASTWAKENGVKVSIDANAFDPATEKNLELVDVLVASEFFYHGLFDNDRYKENLAELQARGPEIVVVTLGSEGCVGVQGGEYFESPAFTQITVADTTGAGDLFHGAFLYGLLQGWSAEETAKFSSAVSAIKCTRLGGRAAIPNRATVDRFLKDGFIDYTEIDERVRFYENGLFNLGGKTADCNV